MATPLPGLAGHRQHDAVRDVSLPPIKNCNIMISGISCPTAPGPRLWGRHTKKPQTHGRCPVGASGKCLSQPPLPSSALGRALTHLEHFSHRCHPQHLPTHLQTLPASTSTPASSKTPSLRPAPTSRAICWFMMLWTLSLVPLACLAAAMGCNGQHQSL